jgi:nucleotide-binding universal stress UspA family protein
MKILIGYDGSDPAKDAIADLQWAGLPERVDAEVLSVADVFPHLPPECYRPPDADDSEESPMIRRARALATQALGEAKQLAEQGASEVRARFPKWTVRPNALGDSPYWGVVGRADQWRPDLIVIGSRGRSVAARVLLGSVSQKTLAYARCSVRIGRPRPVGALSPLRLLIGTDCSPGADAAVAAVAARRWPPRTEAILLTVLDPHTSMALWPLLAAAGPEGGSEYDERASIAPRLSEAGDRLREAGLSVVTLIREGRPADELVKEVEHSGVACIFLGARGLGRVERVLIGSVSSAVAARARCSVEVVRERSVKES